MVVATLILAFVAFKPTNPLIGTWVSATKLPFMGRQKIEFRKDSMITMGIYAKVKYDVDGNTVIVHDDSGTGAVYRVVDKNTIFIEAFGIKSIYKKIE
ncbi:hypothetical protein WCX49_02405 [Sulfurimonas sp. HSL-1656]|uniref:hypothetical protein n=1 Tax=Thiomicrolovo subterrani TaxID=3131934 RepID=UPI0031F76603